MTPAPSGPTVAVDAAPDADPLPPCPDARAEAKALADAGPTTALSFAAVVPTTAEAVADPKVITTLSARPDADAAAAACETKIAVPPVALTNPTTVTPTAEAARTETPTLLGARAADVATALETKAPT